MGDLPDFVSPIDGTVVHGRAGLRRHNKAHNVTNPADFTEEWRKKRIERDKFYSGDTSYDSERRKAAIIRAMEKHRRG
jgi:hypothetical protein